MVYKAHEGKQNVTCTHDPHGQGSVLLGTHSALYGIYSRELVHWKRPDDDFFEGRARRAAGSSTSLHMFMNTWPGRTPFVVLDARIASTMNMSGSRPRSLLSTAVFAMPVLGTSSHWAGVALAALVFVFCRLLGGAGKASAA